jgi:hypothetical protein
MMHPTPSVKKKALLNKRDKKAANKEAEKRAQ